MVVVFGFLDFVVVGFLDFVVVVFGLDWIGLDWVLLLLFLDFVGILLGFCWDGWQRLGGSSGIVVDLDSSGSRGGSGQQRESWWIWIYRGGGGEIAFVVERKKVGEISAGTRKTVRAAISQGDLPSFSSTVLLLSFLLFCCVFFFFSCRFRHRWCVAIAMSSRASGDGGGD